MARTPFNPLSGEPIPTALIDDVHLRMVARHCVLHADRQNLWPLMSVEG